MFEKDRIEQLLNLVSLFSANIVQYKSGQYDESNTRTDFIDKFFTLLLDWDVANNQGFSETYREVVREDKVKIDGSQKAPDYSFRIGGVRKFFVEAKKPSVNIKDAAEPAYQVRRYAYTAKLPLSILTNFEEFAVYDTRIKPGKDDKASTARVFYCTFTQYEQHFDFIFNTFSKNAILKGSFDKYIEENKSKKGTSEVDTELLALVEDWRMVLAKDIAKKNSELSIYSLNTVVQRIIDRIMFLRIAEDRGIETENLLLTVSKTTNIYEKLNLIFTKANVKYNSGLFAYEEWIEKVQIEDKVLSNIIVNLYYPECPYEFSVLPVEILGSIYERFLGKTIHFRSVKGDTHTAVIEEKPEVKKAGGVYYTPQYIVEYIVRNTVGEKIKNKTPEEIANIKICDPACGSGSFLVGAYQYLLNYHLDYYSQAKNVKAALKRGKIFEAGFNSYKLTIEEKKSILTNSIFGVDIDSQAAEVTKLSLYLKLLENEGRETKDWLIKYDYTLLPSLENNIKSGNSLIGTDFYAQPELDLTDDERIKVNCFDWEKGFADIFKDGGFDVVIGNPPWVDIKGLPPNEVDYYFENFRSAENRINLYALFYEKALSILRSNGNNGFITPSSILFQSSYCKLREIMLYNFSVRNIVKLPDNVFQNVTAESCIIITENSNTSDKLKILVYKAEERLDKIDRKIASIDKTSSSKGWKKANSFIFDIYSDNEIIKILLKMETNKEYLEKYCDFSLGITPYDKYRGHTQKQIKDKVFHSTSKKSNEYKMLLRGGDVERYYVSWNGEEYIRYGKFLGAPREERFFSKNHIAVRQIVSGNPLRIYAGYAKAGLYNTQSIFSILSSSLNLKYLLGLLNSKVINFYHRYKYLDLTKNVFQKILIQNCKKFPIPILDLSIKADKTKHDHLVSFVDKMLELKQKEAAEPNQHLKTMLARQIEGVDKAIDKAVYGLYNLREDEIKVVEG
jgi:adenine-specific DNA-methyltransferase